MKSRVQVIRLLSAILNASVHPEAPEDQTPLADALEAVQRRFVREPADLDPPQRLAGTGEAATAAIDFPPA